MLDANPDNAPKHGENPAGATGLGTNLKLGAG